MQCEVCGRQIIGKPNKVIIEGAKMITCEKCVKLGSPYREPEPTRLKTTASKQAKLFVGDFPTRRETIRIPENLEIAEGYGSILRHGREKLSLSYEELGRRIGEKVSVIKKIESEKIVPTQTLATKLENTLRIKLVVPFVEPKTDYVSARPETGLTIGEIVQIKPEKRRTQEDESDHSSTKGTF